MRTAHLVAALLVAAVSTFAYAQDATAPALPVTDMTAAQLKDTLSQTTLTYKQMNGITEPLSIFPDPLLAEILPASTTPVDVVLAARWIADNPKATDGDIDAQSWAAPVKALAHYPIVLKWMNDNLEWTQALGKAYMSQGSDVLMALQRLRGDVKNTGNLQTPADQPISGTDGAYAIMSTNTRVIYVPQYAAAPQRNALPYGFNNIAYAGYPIFAGLDDYRCDWQGHRIIDRSGRDFRGDRGVSRAVSGTVIAGGSIGGGIVYGSGIQYVGGGVLRPNVIIPMGGGALVNNGFYAGGGYGAGIGFNGGFVNPVFLGRGGRATYTAGPANVTYVNPTLPGYGYTFSPQVVGPILAPPVRGYIGGGRGW